MKDDTEILGEKLSEGFANGVAIEHDAEDSKVVFPLERSDGDLIVLWVEQQNDDQFKITDAGETYGMLFLSNINVDLEKRENRIQTIKERYDLDEAKKEITTSVTRSELGRRLLDVAQAVQAVSYLTYTRRQYTQTDFRSDVGAYLANSGFRYDANPEVTGKSETHRVDFSVHGSKQPIYIDSLHAEDASTARDMARKIGYKWNDISLENAQAQTISVADDESGELGSDAANILKTHSDVYIPWSQKDELTQILTA